MSRQKTLQKLTNNGAVSDLLKNDNPMSQQDFDKLSLRKRKQLERQVNAKLSKLKGEDCDKLISKFLPFLPKEEKNRLWMINHTRIKNSLHRLLNEFNRTPSTIEIAKDTELSRQTVHKHLKEFDTNELYDEEIRKYEIMLPDVLGHLYRFGTNGWKPDIRALRLFFDIIKHTQTKTNQETNIQNNFIQINNIRLDQQTVQSLPKDSLNEIEKIISVGIPEKRQD